LSLVPDAVGAKAAAAEVWKCEVSSLKVALSRQGYRMKKRAGKKPSPLDDIRPERWTTRQYHLKYYK